VNATPVRDELLVKARAEQAVVDLAYYPDGRPTALVTAARAAGSRLVVDGLEALVRQGAASFRLWTGVEPPVTVMRTALGFEP
jgi:shikimate dehydrogenase